MCLLKLKRHTHICGIPWENITGQWDDDGGNDKESLIMIYFQECCFSAYCYCLILKKAFCNNTLYLGKFMLLTATLTNKQWLRIHHQPPKRANWRLDPLPQASIKIFRCKFHTLDPLAVVRRKTFQVAILTLSLAQWTFKKPDSGWQAISK